MLKIKFKKLKKNWKNWKKIRYKLYPESIQNNLRASNLVIKTIGGMVGHTY